MILVLHNDIRSVLFMWTVTCITREGHHYCTGNLYDISRIGWLAYQVCFTFKTRKKFLVETETSKLICFCWNIEQKKKFSLEQVAFQFSIFAVGFSNPN